MNQNHRFVATVATALLLAGGAACKSKKSSSDTQATEPAAPKAVDETTAKPENPEAPKEPAVARGTLPADESAPMALDPKVLHGTLDNGLTYYIRKNANPEDRAEFWLSVDVGSFHEDDDQQGLAHFLEHMAFNGTKSFPKNELIAKLESLGVEFGPHLNASTSFDETIYKLRLPTDKPETIELGMTILAEWAGEITLDPKEFEKERGVVLAEKRSRDGAQMRLMQSVISDVFAGTRYANRLPIGIPKVLKKAPLSAIQRFYKDWYHPQNMAVYVVGDVEPEAILAQVKERFGALEAPESPRVAPERKQPTSGEFSFLTLQDDELPLTAVALGRLIPKKPNASLSDARARYTELLATLMITKRLEEAQKRGKSRYLMAGGSPVPLLRKTEATAFFAMVDPNDIEGGLEDLLIEIERARRHGFTASELARANKEVLSLVESAAKEDAENKEQSLQLVDELVKHQLSGDATPGRAVELAMIDNFSETIKAEDVSAVLKNVLAPEGLIAMSIGNASKDVLSKEKVLAMLADLPNKTVAAYADSPSNTELISEAPTPGTIVSEKHYPKTDVHEWTLSNGAVVVLKATDFKSDEVYFSASSAGGTSSIEDAAALAPIRQAASVVEQGGLGTMDAIALQKALAGRMVEVSPYIGRLSEGIYGNSSVADAETMLQMVHLYFTAPRKDETAFAQYKKNTITSLKLSEKSPEQRFYNEFVPWVNNKDPRKTIWDSAAAEKIELDASMEFFRDRIKNAGDFRFVLVGSFKVEEIKDAVLTYIGSLPDDGRRETLTTPVWDQYPARKVVKSKDGTQKRASIYLVYDKVRGEGVPSDTEMLAWDVFARASRMHFLELFREELGETYSVSVRSDFERNFSHAIARVMFQVAPERAVAAAKKAESEFARLAKEGVTEEHFTKAKEALVKGHEVDLRDNEFWRSELEDAYFYGRSPEETASLAESIANLTREDVLAVTKSYLDTSKPLVGMHLPSK